MKRLAAAVALLFAALFASFALTIEMKSEDAVYHDHKVYQLYWSPETKNPVVVWWTLTDDQAIESDAASNRTNDFRECLLGSATKLDYYKSSFDRGHLCPSNDFDYSRDIASLTFLMCNICPQTAKLNRGAWKKYEAYGHKLATAYGRVEIVCGPIYNQSKAAEAIGNKVRVPDYFFKAFHYVEDGKSIVECYLFDQSGNVQTTTLRYFEDASKMKVKF